MKDCCGMYSERSQPHESRKAVDSVSQRLDDPDDTTGCKKSDRVSSAAAVDARDYEQSKHGQRL